MLHKKRRYYFTGIPIIIAVLFVASCKTKKDVAGKEPLPEKTAFYTLEARRDTVKKSTDFSIVKVTVVNSKINYTPDLAKSKRPDFLKIEIETKGSGAITAYTEHPLFKKFDLYSESGEIGSKLIPLLKGQVTLRVPYFENYKTIKITETINFKVSDIKTIKYEK